MRILWIVPITSPDAASMERTVEFLKPYLFGGTEIVMRKTERGTESIESRLDEVYATVPTLELAIEGEREGFDACIIGCAGDAGVAEVKEVLTIPVIGPGEASMLIARQIGKRIAVLTTLPERVPSLDDKVRQFIPPDRFFIYATNIPVVEFRNDLRKTTETLCRIVENSMEKDGADTALLACLGMAGMADELHKRVGIPVIDPGVAAVQYAQMMAKMGIAQAKGAYPKPPDKKRWL
jgi:allantoin racemase